MGCLLIEMDCKCVVEVSFDYRPATKRLITSQSLEPNDEEELDIYEVRLDSVDLPTKDDGWLAEQVLEEIHKLRDEREVG
jgi:hypothetical protein